MSQETATAEMGAVTVDEASNRLSYGSGCVGDGQSFGIEVGCVDIHRARSGGGHGFSQAVGLGGIAVARNDGSFLTVEGDVNLAGRDDDAFLIDALTDQDVGTHVLAEIRYGVDGFLYGEEVTAAVFGNDKVVAADAGG